MLVGNNPNIELLEKTVEKLGKLADKMVFVGGCATGLLITDAAAPPMRRTVDVDVITDVNRLEYYQLGDQLRVKGFTGVVHKFGHMTAFERHSRFSYLKIWKNNALINLPVQ